MTLAYDTEFDDELEPEGMEEEAEQGFDLQSAIQSPNIAHDLDDELLARIGRKVVDEFELDENSLKDNGWTDRCQSALKLAMLAKDSKDYPWPGASNIKYPLLITAAIQFNARAYPAIVDGYSVAKGKVLGRPNDDKRARADRIGRHMSWQLIEEMKGWEEDTDRLLLMLPIVGCLFRKTYFDPIKGYNCSHLVLPDKFVADYWTRDLETAPRVTQVCEYYPNEIETKFRSELWKRQELGQVEGEDEQTPHTFLEQHRLWDLDEDGYEEPYIVTVHKETARVVRIVARFDEEGVRAGPEGIVAIEPISYFTKYSFLPSPDGGFFDMGFGTLLHPLNETINTTINQLMDAGHLANVQGGFIGSGVSIKSGNLRFKPGEWKKIDAAGGALKENVVPLPAKEPSTVLFNLLGLLIETTKEVTATKDILTGDTQGANTPVGTTLALIEQGLKVFSAIYKRIHRSLKGELACLYRLNRKYLSPEVYFAFQDEDPQQVTLDDYRATDPQTGLPDIDVIPVSDPTVVTDMQRLGRAQFLMQFRPDPLMNGEEINRRVLEAASIPEVDQLFAPPPEGPPPEMLAQMAELENKKRELDIKAADTQAKNAKARADILEILVNLSRREVEGPDGEKMTVAAPLDPAIGDIVDSLMAEAEEDVNGPLQPADVRGMEGPSPDGAPPEVLQGPAGDPGQGMDGGPGPLAGPADQSATPGGPGEPPVGGL